MTNTGDFRRYSYSTEAAYAVQAFNYQRTSAAPSYVPTPKKDFKVRERSQRKSIVRHKAATTEICKAFFKLNFCS